MTRSTRTSLFLSTVVVALMLFAAFAVSALGAPGDSQENATLLNDYFGSSLTTSLAGGTSAGMFTAYHFKVELDAGQTLTADFTPAPNILGFGGFLGDSAEYPLVNSVQVSPSLYRITYTAPAHGAYTIYVATSGTSDATTTPATFTVVPTVQAAPPVTPAIKYSLTTFSAPSKVKKKKSFALSVKLWPAYSGSGSPVKFIFQQKSGKKWKSVSWGTISSKVAAATSSYTRYGGSAKLPKGTFRVRAKFADATHGAIYTGYKTITAK